MISWRVSDLIRPLHFRLQYKLDVVREEGREKTPDSHSTKRERGNGRGNGSREDNNHFRIGGIFIPGYSTKPEDKKNLRRNFLGKKKNGDSERGETFWNEVGHIRVKDFSRLSSKSQGPREEERTGAIRNSEKYREKVEKQTRDWF